MVSFAHPEHLPLVADVCQSFALDNGAFTTWTKGTEFDFDGYCAWVSEWMTHPCFDWALIPDVIDGSAAENDALLKRFADRFGWLAPIVPVWHLHEDIRRLRWLCGAFRRVAFGSSGQWQTPGTEDWMDRMDEAMAAVTINGRPYCKFHGLRMLSRDIFPLYPFSSADSANAAVNAVAVKRFGTYPAPLSAERADNIAQGIEFENSAPVWTPRDRTEAKLFA